MSLFVVAQRSCWCDSPGCRITRASTWDQTELWHLQLICARFILVAQDGAKASMGHIFFTAPLFFLIVSFLLRLMWLSVKRCGLIHPVQMHLGSVRWVERELDPLFFPFILTPPQSSFSWTQCFTTLAYSGHRTSCVLPSRLFAHEHRLSACLETSQSRFMMLLLGGWLVFSGNCGFNKLWCSEWWWGWSWWGTFDEWTVKSDPFRFTC